jgi:hypothetical protein
LGVLRGCPIVIIADPQLLPTEAARVLSELDLVAVGLTDAGVELPDFDVVTGEEEVVEAVSTTIANCPTAAVMCCQVLRKTEGMSINLGLLLESTAYGTLQAGKEFAQWLAQRNQTSQADDYGPVVVNSQTDETITLTLNRPAVMNAYSADMRDSLVEALRALSTPGDERSILIEGAGETFCTGGDLSEFGTVEDPSMAYLIRSTNNVARWIHLLRDRLTVRVHGAAVGAGAELAACAGRVEATSDAWFSLPEVTMGLIPGAGGTTSLPRRIGRQRTARLCLTGERLDAATAARWGLVDQIID